MEELRRNTDIYLSPTLATQCAFRASMEQLPDELSINQLLHSRLNQIPSYRIAHAAIRNRNNGLKAGFAVETPAIETKIKPRIALLVCGQFINPELMIAKLAQQYDLPGLDVYVSTWKTPESTPIDRAGLNRRLAPDAIEIVDRQFTDDELALIAKYEQNKWESGSNMLVEQIREGLKKAKSLQIFAADERDVVYSSMDHHQKIHFHNSYWVRKLGHQYFLSNYDILIKMRPDILMDAGAKIGSEWVQDPGRNIACDHPQWLYEPWGFGAGDQFFYGRTSVMLPLLDIQYPKSLSTRLLSETFGLARTVQGHLSIGIELWLTGGNPIPASIVKKGLASERKLSYDEFIVLAALAGVYKNH